MVKYYTHTFSVGNRLIYVPSDDGRRAGIAIIKAVKAKWPTPPNYFHLRAGGHLGAVKIHLGNRFFLRLDLSNFFGSVTRSKVHRALRWLGIPHIRALEYASVSTVRGDDARGRRILPFGYPQSPLLASLALNNSLLGKVLASACGLSVSVYMDDILCSSEDMITLDNFRVQCYAAATASDFQINDVKSSGPSDQIGIFNLIVKQHSVNLTDERLALFNQRLASASSAATNAINAYIKAATIERG